jgi:hypothetical protein
MHWWLSTVATLSVLASCDCFVLHDWYDCCNRDTRLGYCCGRLYRALRLVGEMSGCAETDFYFVFYRHYRMFVFSLACCSSFMPLLACRYVIDIVIYMICPLLFNVKTKLYLLSNENIQIIKVVNYFKISNKIIIKCHFRIQFHSGIWQHNSRLGHRDKSSQQFPNILQIVIVTISVEYFIKIK